MVFLIWLYVTWVYAVPLIADRGAGPIDALTRSRAMVARVGWLSTFVCLLLLGLATWAISFRRHAGRRPQRRRRRPRTGPHGAPRDAVRRLLPGHHVPWRRGRAGRPQYVAPSAGGFDPNGSWPAPLEPAVTGYAAPAPYGPAPGGYAPVPPPPPPDRATEAAAWASAADPLAQPSAPSASSTPSPTPPSPRGLREPPTRPGFRSEPDAQRAGRSFCDRPRSVPLKAGTLPRRSRHGLGVARPFDDLGRRHTMGPSWSVGRAWKGAAA